MLYGGQGVDDIQRVVAVVGGGVLVEETPLQDIRAHVRSHMTALDALAVVAHNRSLNFVVVVTLSPWK